MVGNFQRAIFAVLMVLVCTHASKAATVLEIPPRTQSTAVWCWLAVGEMIFRYYKIPANHANYQCGEARFQGAFPTGARGANAFVGPCWQDCQPCMGVSAGAVDGLVNMVIQYPYGMSLVTGDDRHLLQRPLVSGPMQPEAVKEEIDKRRPIIAGISPGPESTILPTGLAKHAVLIVGYDNRGTTLIINDPFPYRSAGLSPPYIEAGGRQLLAEGQYAISRDAMVDQLKWNTAVYGIGR